MDDIRLTVTGYLPSCRTIFIVGCFFTVARFAFAVSNKPASSTSSTSSAWPFFFTVARFVFAVVIVPASSIQPDYFFAVNISGNIKRITIAERIIK